MSMMLAFSPASLTFIFIWASGISFLLFLYTSLVPSYSPRRLCREPCSGFISGFRGFYHGAPLVGEDAHEVREARYIEDLHVVLAQVAGEQATMRGARFGEQAHYKGYASRVDVVDPLEVEQYGLGIAGLGLRVGRVQGLLGEAVDLAHQVENGDAAFLSNLNAEVAHVHHLPPSAPRWTTSSTV